MEHYLLLESSRFELEPPAGKLLYKTPAGKPVEEPLIPSKEVSQTIPYELLNPLQTLFLKKYREGNALISAPTSAGKSLIAFLFMRKNKGVKVYVAPTKSLVYEKVLELRKLFRKRVDMRTGDIIELYKKRSSDIVVATYENFVLALRNRVTWATEAEAVVIDEIHHIIGSRGWIVEELITYLLENGVNVLGLSATLPDGQSLAQWIKAELFIESFWRPVPLERQIIPLTDFKEFTKPNDQDERIASKLLSALYELKKPDEQVILFVHKKNIGWKLLELANREKIGVMNETTPFEKDYRKEKEIAFHNADIPKEEREEIEKAFRKGELPVLVATHTLAYGVNLPADTVIISVRAFFDRRSGKWKIFPSQLDILQMEGRAGRLGIKNKGYSFILPYGARAQTVEKEVRASMEEGFEPFLKKSVKENSMSNELRKVLSLFILIGFLYEGRNFRNFLKKSFSLRDFAQEPVIDEVYEWLEDKGYIDGSKLSDKALFCIRSGMSPLNYEEFLRRKLLGLDKLPTVRPLLFVKRFDGLFEFLKGGESFLEDEIYVRNKLAHCGGECFADNTHQLLFYTEGLTFKYPNLQHPPGEFSYLGTDSLHLIRTLLEIRSFGDIDWNNREILTIAHCIKFGLTEEYAPLGGIKGIGHIRANLLKKLLYEEGLKPPPLGSPTDQLLDMLAGLDFDLTERLTEILSLYRYRKNIPKAEQEARQVLSRLRGNAGGFLVDDRILRAFGLFLLGESSIRLSKRDLLERILEGT